MASSIIQAMTQGKSRFLSLEYVLAAAAAILAVVTIMDAVRACFALWGGSVVSVGLPASLFFNVDTGYVAAVTLGVASVVFSLSAYLLFGRVTRSVAERTGYTKRRVYKITTYGAFGALAAMALLLAIELVSIMVSSFLLIGSESSINSLYLDQFLPQLLGLMLTIAAGYLYYRITIGQNTSRTLSRLLLTASYAVLLALIVTVAVQAHDGYSANDYGQAKQGVELEDFGVPSIDDWYWR